MRDIFDRKPLDPKGYVQIMGILRQPLETNNALRRLKAPSGINELIYFLENHTGLLDEYRKWLIRNYISVNKYAVNVSPF